MSWTPANIPPQNGRVAIVTGSNTGLGLETAAALAGKGAKTILACRTPAKAEAAKAEIESRHGEADVEILALDLGNLAQIADAAVEANERFPTIDLLINNAGVMIPPKSTTADGFELQFGTNHLGHFAFTGRVLDSVLKAKDSRIVTVSSIAHKQGRMRWDDLQWEGSYNRSQAYGQSKLANLLFTFELQKKLDAADPKKVTGTIALAAHPGVSATELARHVPGARVPGLKQVIDLAMSVTTQPASAGAEPTLRAATDPDAQASQYYGPDGFQEMRGHAVVVQPMPHAQRKEDWARLWALSEELTGVTYPI